MTQAQRTGAWVNARLEVRGPVSLTDIFHLQIPIHLIALGQDEIAFVYHDGSWYTTGLTSDDEYMEFMILRTILEALKEGTPS